MASLAQRSAPLVVQRAPSPEATETLPIAVDFALENGFSRSVPHRGDVARWLTQMAASGSGQSQRAQLLLDAIDPDGNASLGAVRLEAEQLLNRHTGTGRSRRLPRLEQDLQRVASTHPEAAEQARGLLAELTMIRARQQGLRGGSRRGAGSTPPGGGGGGAGPGTATGSGHGAQSGGATPGPTTPSTETFGKAKLEGRTVTEGRGAPMEPITGPARFETRAAAEGAVTMILALQLGMLRSGEAARAADRLKQLQQSDIGPQLARGRAVAVTLVMEVPNQVDIAAIWAGIGDTGQVVYFKNMFVSSVAVPGRPSDSDVAHAHYHENEARLTHPVNEPWFVRDNRKENLARPGFHLVERTLTLQPPPSYRAPGADRFAGSYRPISLQTRSGNSKQAVQYGMGRLFHWDPTGDFEMWDLNEREPFRTTGGGTALPGQISQHFVRGAEGHEYVLDSTMELVRDNLGPRLIETVSGVSLDPQWRLNSRWTAKVWWIKR